MKKGNEPNPELQPSQRPSNLDIIKVDGRWAQCASIGPEDSTIRFLDDNSVAYFTFDDYKLVKHIDTKLDILRRVSGEMILNDTELANAHFGEDDKKHPELKLYITVFGEYIKK